MIASDLELFARCAMGFEKVLAQELKALGMRRVRPLHGAVAFFGTQRDAYRACLWSRVATRIQLVLARIPAADADELYQGVASFPWEKHVRDGATIAVRAHGTNAKLRNTQFTALRVKDGLCDRLRDVRGARPNVDAGNPDFAVDVALHEQRATLNLNLSGSSLHRRGYRQDGVQTEAPIKETLAAGILLAAGWDDLVQVGGVLVDPMCGSGTFAVEGALIAADVAPGILRASWGFMGWVRHDDQLWQELLAEAHERRACAAPYVRIMASDLDARAIEVARANAERAGVADLITFGVGDAAQLSKRLRGAKGAPGLMVANPPYGLRLLSQSELPQVNQALAAAVEALPHGWLVALITPDLGVDTALGRLPEQTIACFNGPVETWARIYDTSEKRQRLEVIALSGTQRNVPVADLASDQFAGRLRKVAKERGRWARKQNISCYRTYDADVPDYPLSIDLYHGADADVGQLYAVIEERPRPKAVDVQRAGRHFADAVALTCALLDIPPSNVVQKPWTTDARYARSKDARDDSRIICVAEEDLHFRTDLSGTAGKCLPISLRTLRAMVAKQSPGKRFANLFATTNAATVCAAQAGARSTITVDTSRERLAWVQQALADNSLAGPQHRTPCEDVRTWLTREARSHRAYDLVLCAPPNRLAAHGNKGRDWNLERDLDALADQLVKVLAPNGTAILVLPEGVSRPSIQAEDITAKLLPHDFERSRDFGRYYLLRKHP